MFLVVTAAVGALTGVAGAKKSPKAADTCLGFTLKQISKTLPSPVKLQWDRRDPSICWATPLDSSLEALKGYAVQYRLFADPSGGLYAPKPGNGQDQQVPMSGLSKGLQGYYVRNEVPSTSIEAFVRRSKAGKIPARTAVVDVENYSPSAPTLPLDQLVSTARKTANLVLAKAKTQLSPG